MKALGSRAAMHEFTLRIETSTGTATSEEARVVVDQSSRSCADTPRPRTTRSGSWEGSPQPFDSRQRRWTPPKKSVFASSPRLSSVRAWHTTGKRARCTSKRTGRDGSIRSPLSHRVRHPPTARPPLAWRASLARVVPSPREGEAARRVSAARRRANAPAVPAGHSQCVATDTRRLCPGLGTTLARDARHANGGRAVGGCRTCDLVESEWSRHGPYASMCSQPLSSCARPARSRASEKTRIPTSSAASTVSA